LTLQARRNVSTTGTVPRYCWPEFTRIAEIGADTARVRFVLVAGVAFVLTGPVLELFLARLVLSRDAVLLDHVAQRRTTGHVRATP